MTRIFVIDTVAFINFYNDFFEEERFLSRNTLRIIEDCLNSEKRDYKLIIPSVVLVEIFDKQLKTDEKTAEFKYNILKPLMENEDVEIKSIEPEVLAVISDINDPDYKIENHDLIVLSSAVQMGATLITKDRKVISFLNKKGLIPHII